MRNKVGNYDVLRKQLIELELNYRNAMLSKTSQEEELRDKINATESQNS